MTARAHDRVQVSVLVAVSPDDAFGELFTSVREHAADRKGPGRSG